MERENLDFKEVKFITTDEVEGKVEAVFSVFNEVDSDGDVVLPTAIKSGFKDKGVPMVWAHDWKKPIGRGEIVTDDNVATFKGQFIMDTDEGRNAFNTVKAMGDLQQWSFGYEVKDSENGKFQKDNGEIDVRFLKELDVWEVSPVLVGANQNTYTASVKEKKEDPNQNTGMKFDDEVEKVLNTLTTLLKRAKELTALRIKKGKLLSEGATDSLITLSDTLQEVFQDIDSLLAAASPVQIEEEEVTLDDTELLLETQKILDESLDIELDEEIT